MSYTPINWQTGDQITAAKLNKMDSGWEITGESLFSETVTTVQTAYGNMADLDYTGDESPDTLSINFDGVEYICERQGEEGEYMYGASSPSDYSQYPFMVAASSTEPWLLVTEEAGEHTISCEISLIQISENFRRAVNECVSSLPLQLIPNVTTIAEATNSNGLLYFRTEYHGTFIVTLPSVDCTIIPESNAVQAHFGRDDGLFYFTET